MTDLNATQTASPSPAPRMAPGKCVHCKSPVPEGAANPEFCCHGCEAVHGLLTAQGLTRYYDLAGTQVSPAATPGASRSLTWLSPLVERAEGQGQNVCSLSVDVQGIHCAACVWLMNETFKREQGAVEITVNPALGKVRLLWKKGEADLAGWVRRVEAFGYQFGPARKKATRRSIDLPLRLGLSAALTLNVMLFSLSFYFGLASAENEAFTLFTWLSVALTTAVVLIGGWPFFVAAWRGLKSRVLHLDLPIAVGIVLVYSACMVQVGASGRGDLAYFDTLNTFITLMLLGRFLQERVVEKNRRYLLEDDGADSIVARRVEGERLVSIAAPLIKAEDLLLVAPGDLVPVDATLVEPKAAVSTDWITGEPTPRELSSGADVEAGSFNAGTTAFHVVAKTDFERSQLVSMLRAAPRATTPDEPGHQKLWNVLAKGWVIGVLTLAAAGFLLWLPKGFLPAMNVAAALLVVTCPCAIGLSIPLAYELTLTRLRRLGFFARSPDLLDRLTRVKKLVFDKTGTLTLGRLELTRPEELLALDPATRDVAYNLAVRSSHPVSSLVARELAKQGARYDASAQVTEVQGKGMEWKSGGALWRLGRSEWAAPLAAPRRTALAKDGLELASFLTAEVLRPDAKKELSRLMSHGYEVWLLSGDSNDRVRALAEKLSIPTERAIGQLRPEDKARQVELLDRQDTLYLGDGVNDALAFERSLAAGTPAIDRPVMPGRSAFFLVGEGLSQIKAALARSEHLRVVVRRVLTVSLAYNVFAVASCLLGHMTPLTAAISMPLSTLTLLGITVASLKDSKNSSNVAEGR